MPPTEDASREFDARDDEDDEGPGGVEELEKEPGERYHGRGHDVVDKYYD